MICTRHILILFSVGVLHWYRNTPRFQLKNLTYTVLRIIYSILITRKMASGHKSIESDHYKMNAHDLYDMIISNRKNLIHCFRIFDFIFKRIECYIIKLSNITYRQFLHEHIFNVRF